MITNSIIRGVFRGIAAATIVVASTASAQLPFPRQNASGPSGAAYQTNYPYPGQCVADSTNFATLFPSLNACTAGLGSSFACDASGNSYRTAGGWATCGRVVPFTFKNPVAPDPALKFQWPVLNPMDYTPDTTTFPGADYYEIGLHEATGFQAIASAGTALNGAVPNLGLALFPDPRTIGGPAVPNGMQWTGLRCNTSGGCTCPSDAGATYPYPQCATPGSKIPFGSPLYTPIWGVGQINKGGGPVTQALNGANPLGAVLFDPAAQRASDWSANDYVATWPSISIRGTRGKPVVVKWVNEFPNNHVLCPHPDAADWPCAIDRTFMGVKTKIDPAALQGMTVAADRVNAFGSPQQPDNSWVTHLHGGEIPPSTDGFAEKWFGNRVTANLYNTPDGSGNGKLVNPPFENPSAIALRRPVGNSDTYTYPMVNDEATIWFHDHTLGKTHHNVIAGPAGFFPVRDPAKHGKVANGACQAAAPQTDCDYTWLDPVTEPRGTLNIPKYDMFFAIQDRSFNDDGSIDFSNGLGQPIVGAPLVPGNTPFTNGVNPLVHPVWIPEYFGDHVLVNGVLWPKMATEPGWYRLRLVDGSDSRCWTIGFSTTQPASNAKPVNNVSFYVIANDQGYLKTPVLAPSNQFTMCPGERYELLVNFGALPGGARTAFMTNSAAAPFPAGITPYAVGSIYKEMNVIMRFDVGATGGVKTCGAPGAPAKLSWDPALSPDANLATACMPVNPALVAQTTVPTTTDSSFQDLRAFAAGAVVRQVYLNERLDGVTAAPMGMQLNGVPFEYKVTETPKTGTKEVWKFINLTVDAHPMHPHFIKHQIVERQRLNVGAYKALLCGSTTCQPGTAPGGEMQVVPDVTQAGLLINGAIPVTAASVEGGFKDAVQVPPGMVTTIIADWTPRWNAGAATAPGTAGAPSAATCPLAPAQPNTNQACQAASWVYEPVTSGPYVWHCHINSHEDSEMMRTSLVVP